MFVRANQTPFSLHLSRLEHDVQGLVHAAGRRLASERRSLHLKHLLLQLTAFQSGNACYGLPNSAVLA
ncbi:hypothetical protein HG549_15325 [Pseudomonas sp. SK]|uniref:hypothetical protein n=1 Tax=Pseudomonas sp. SK TaxID=2729423 RepID=UPI0014639701|nr:hypothetical protein [Pseudomonas sp. SK]QJQ20327.1 hypothetical protein HG549_10415 [Pseudomonas sp. SK]QJQ21248.1 hypothetical protein HG549_15325 [Pseudomonas sp. SK]